MLRNGSYFLSLVETEARQIGVWDPYAYRSTSKTSLLGRFVDIKRVSARNGQRGVQWFAPIEYRHVHPGTSPVFTLEEMRTNDSATRFPCVAEETLLFGTMRAYLGNALVTPRAQWLGKSNAVLFPVKSEFVEIHPKDGLVYFWKSFFQSSKFLQTLPAGGGGTRPRLDIAALSSLSVDVPELEVRQEIHTAMAAFAERAWSDYIRAAELLEVHALK